VDDLAEGMGRLARGAGLLGLVDRLADAVAEAGSPGDPDLPDGSHDGSIIACDPWNPGERAEHRRLSGGSAPGAPARQPRPAAQDLTVTSPARCRTRRPRRTAMRRRDQGRRR